ncbi:MAG TPA: Glu-tRNA(Gln) amidotransferase subunit GatE [Candidatus Altiarchaeales archaeon]|nr:Glu-tRNA(Gln) amidotransferase subunit GatE [Candidatus Altiarchaeales archaeon]
MPEELDYEKLGFKCGLEIHQQLDTHKLFCPCPSAIRDDAPDITVERQMRAVPGEMGGVDPAALHEFLRGRKLVYEAYEDTNCLIELDEEPPAPLNREALEISLQVALLLNATPVDVIQAMRKTVVDGSNTTGFQRTMLVAMDGSLETSLGNVGIPSICLEEDAARKIKEDDGVVTYRLDRLGIPLVEIATDPDIKNPAHAKEVAERLGSILRACKVKRGLGTIRQDLNVSIANGERIEVKGVQDLTLISKIVEGEVERQLMLIELKKKLIEAKISAKDFEVQFVDLKNIFEKSESKVLKKALDVKNPVILGVKLKNLKGELKGRFGPELAMYAKANSNVKGLFHTDELPAYGITEYEVSNVSKAVGCSQEDAFAIIAGEKEQAEKALNAVLDRCKTALECVPDETRTAKDDGTTAYMRPLPGRERMYPETDELLIEVSQKTLEEIRKTLPELREEKAKRFEEMGLSAELASQLSRDGKNVLFEKLAGEYRNADPTTIATTLTAVSKEASKRYGADLSKITEYHYEQIISLLDEGALGKDAIVEVIAKTCEKPDKKVADIVKENDLGLLSDKQLEGLVKTIVKSNKDLIDKMGGKAVGPLTGKIMAQSKGKADAKKVREILSKLL